MGPYHPVLPAELWSRVFTFSVNNHPDSRDAILHVNRAFRFIANGTPQLWTRISVRCRRDVLDPQRMKAGLQKSGALPLHVYIFMTNNTDIVQPLAKYLRKHVSRFQTLSLHLESAQVIAEFFFSFSAMGQDCPAPLLQQLTLEVFDTKEDESFTLGNIFHPSPRLEYLSIPPTLFPAVINATLLPTVKHFTFAGEVVYDNVQDPDRVINLLSQMPLMESFTFRATDIDSDSLLSNSIVMPHLLSADVTVPGSGLEVLSGIKSPLLKCVRLDGCHCYVNKKSAWVDHRSQLLVSALRRLSRHSPKISHLKLIEIDFKDPEVTYPWILGNGFPSLEVLSIVDCYIMDDDLRLCKPLKMMRRLELGYCSQLTRDGLLHVVEARSSDFELILYQCCNIAQDDVTALSDVVKVEYTEVK